MVTVKVTSQGTVTTEVDKTGVEHAIVAEVLQWFCLTEKWSTFWSRYVAECLCLVGTSADAE